MHNILILGSGGREHTLAWKLCQSDQCQDLFVMPGNGGTAQIATNVDIDILDFPAVAEYCKSKKIDYVIVGPEQPLVEGIVDYFSDNAVGIKILGPTKFSAQLEGSKDFAKQFMKAQNIPTAGYQTFNKASLNEGLNYLEERPGPYVLKADGLAAGKGVLIIQEKDKAKEALTEMLDGKFGMASSQVVIEDFLDGIEFSVFVLTDGKSYVLLPEAKDYKRIGEGDTGLNTGGMGAISPVSFVDDELMAKVDQQIIKPTIEGLQKEKMKYFGFIFFGLIKVGKDPFVIEYNCRLGDPETEAIIPRIESDLMELVISCFSGSLDKQAVKFSEQSAGTVMLVSGGYPEKYDKGYEILLPENFKSSLLFHAGTKNKEGKLHTNGGRVLAVTSMDVHFKNAVKQSSQLANEIQFEGKNFRKDIGFDL